MSSETSNALDGQLEIWVLTSILILASMRPALERLATCLTNSLKQACYSISVANIAFWTSLHFLLETPLAISIGVVLRAKDQDISYRASPSSGQFA
jgi:hypothetical protein